MGKTKYETLIEKADYCLKTAYSRKNISEWARNWMKDVSSKLRIQAGNLPVLNEKADSILCEYEQYR